MKLKVEAKVFVPVVLDFAKEYLPKKDFKKFKEQFGDVEVEKDTLVKNGGLKAMLESFLKSNAKVRKEFQKVNGVEEEKPAKKGSTDKKKKLVGRKRSASKAESDSDAESIKKPAQKRARADSNISTRSLRSASAKKGGVSSRKSSGEWQPKDHGPAKGAKEYKFQRIDESKFTHLKGSEADYSYEAKLKFGTEGDTYGDWSNQRLKDKVGKGFTKEKNKMKNRNFHASGGRFNMNVVNSIPM